MRKTIAFVLIAAFWLSYIFLPIPFLPEGTIEAAAEETETDTASDSDPAAASLGITSPGAILMETRTGQILYEQGSHKQLRPASVTKIMTILLAYEAVRDGKATMDDMVTVSDNAAGYGGSTILLESGEQIALKNLIKGMCIASGNDAAIATAEYIGGSQEGFVALMNQRAQELGMNDTHFVNPCGLDADGHVTSAHDIALMSRELLNHFPEVTEYTTTWHEMMPHVWRSGPGETDMANTNKMIQSYEGMTGLKTGFTRLAKYSLSGTATRGDLSLIAVIMGAETKEIRTSEVTALLNYGFGNYGFLNLETDGTQADTLTISGSNIQQLPVLIQGNVGVLTNKGQSLDPSSLQTEIVYAEPVSLPVKAGDPIGEIIYRSESQEIARLPLVAGCDAERAGFIQILSQLTGRLLGRPARQDQTPSPADESLPEN
ncbi:MAG: D-alanyl-D-alanine carboxypeptidase [Lachnospiraceae bacterium]|jgi:D-alanyl-D-alanine carboxypeptidase (penicillin-binding protein 5/6)|nr:D-alanyl-D-alanine carboxypeptidase [Lachnospiraceae bacterium]